MNHVSAIPTESDDWLEHALRDDGREHRDDYLADDGFTARVMTALPAPAALPAWRKPALAVLWGGAGIGIALTLPGVVVDAASQILRVLSAQPVSLTGIALGVVALAAASWAAAAVALSND
jgi:hypothetical protein